MNFLYAAYAATWIIHIVYLGTLARRYTRLRDKMAELKKTL
jgi:CcmD family protein